MSNDKQSNYKTIYITMHNELECLGCVYCDPNVLYKKPCCTKSKKRKTVEEGRCIDKIDTSNPFGFDFILQKGIEFVDEILNDPDAMGSGTKETWEQHKKDLFVQLKKANEWDITNKPLFVMIRNQRNKDHHFSI